MNCGRYFLCECHFSKKKFENESFVLLALFMFNNTIEILSCKKTKSISRKKIIKYECKRNFLHNK